MSKMKQPEYIEGPKALENFERGMIALFKLPKAAIETARKKGRKLAMSVFLLYFPSAGQRCAEEGAGV